MEPRRQIDIDSFSSCPKYQKHDLTDDQILEIATKAARIGVELAKNEAKLEIFDAGLSTLKRITFTTGAAVFVIVQFWQDILKWLVVHFH
jgi:phage FluMu gp28-like protein